MTEKQIEYKSLADYKKANFPTPIYEQEKEAEQQAFKLYSKAKSGKNPFISQQPKLVQKYFYYYQNRDDVQKNIELQKAYEQDVTRYREIEAQRQQAVQLASSVGEQGLTNEQKRLYLEAQSEKFFDLSAKGQVLGFSTRYLTPQQKAKADLLQSVESNRTKQSFKPVEQYGEYFIGTTPEAQRVIESLTIKQDKKMLKDFTSEAYMQVEVVKAKQTPKEKFIEKTEQLSKQFLDKQNEPLLYKIIPAFSPKRIMKGVSISTPVGDIDVDDREYLLSLAFSPYFKLRTDIYKELQPLAVTKTKGIVTIKGVKGKPKLSVVKSKAGTTFADDIDDITRFDIKSESKQLVKVTGKKTSLGIGKQKTTFIDAKKIIEEPIKSQARQLGQSRLVKDFGKVKVFGEPLKKYTAVEIKSIVGKEKARQLVFIKKLGELTDDITILSKGKKPVVIPKSVVYKALSTSDYKVVIGKKGITYRITSPRLEPIKDKFLVFDIKKPIKIKPKIKIKPTKTPGYKTNYQGLIKDVDRTAKFTMQKTKPLKAELKIDLKDLSEKSLSKVLIKDTKPLQKIPKDLISKIRPAITPKIQATQVKTTPIKVIPLNLRLFTTDIPTTRQTTTQTQKQLNIQRKIQRDITTPDEKFKPDESTRTRTREATATIQKEISRVRFEDITLQKIRPVTTKVRTPARLRIPTPRISTFTRIPGLINFKFRDRKPRQTKVKRTKKRKDDLFLTEGFTEKVLRFTRKIPREKVYKEALSESNLLKIRGRPIIK